MNEILIRNTHFISERFGSREIKFFATKKKQILILLPDFRQARYWRKIQHYGRKSWMSFLSSVKNIIFEKIQHMTEIIFIVEESPEGGYQAKALGESIFTEADSISALKNNIKEALRCHFEQNMPKMVRLHYIREEFFAA